MRDALGVSPGAAGNWNNLAVVLKKQGRLGEAVGAYREALARDPELASAWSNLCDALRSFPSESFDPAIGREANGESIDSGSSSRLIPERGRCVVADPPTALPPPREPAAAIPPGDFARPA